MNHNKQDQRRDQILEAALTVLIRKGYENSRMDDIVRESNLSKGAIYWYYKSKKEIYLSLVNHWVLRYSATLNHIVEEGLPAARQLEKLFQYFIDQYEHNTLVFRAMMEFWALAARDDDFHSKVQKVYTEFLNLIKRIVTQGLQSGEFRTGDVTVTALSIMLNIEGIMWFTVYDTPGITVRNYIEAVTAFIIRGLTNESQGG